MKVVEGMSIKGVYDLGKGIFFSKSYIDILIV